MGANGEKYIPLSCDMQWQRDYKIMAIGDHVARSKRGYDMRGAISF